MPTFDELKIVLRDAVLAGEARGERLVNREAGERVTEENNCRCPLGFLANYGFAPTCPEELSAGLLDEHTFNVFTAAYDNGPTYAGGSPYALLALQYRARAAGRSNDIGEGT